MRYLGLATCLLVAAGVGAVDARMPDRQAGADRHPAEGLYTSIQAARGKVIYVERCVLCHLEDLSGDQLYNPGPELAGRVFRARWKGHPVSGLFTVIKTGMPYETPGTLTDREVVDLLAFIFEKNGFPPGSSELQPGHDLLAKIRIPGDD